MTKPLRSILRFSVFLALGVFFTWWSIKDISVKDRQYLSDALSRMHYLLAIPGFIVLLASHWIRALRWKLLIEPLGYTPSVSNTFFSVMTGYLANQAVPRLGEVLRCSTLARYEKIPLDNLFGTVILERLIDTICLLLIFLITLAIQPDLYIRIVNTFFSSNASGNKSSLIMYGLIGAGILAAGIVIWMLIAKKKISDVTAIIKSIITRVWQGGSSIRHLKKKWLFIIYTLLIWLLYAACGYIGFLAFDEMQRYGVKEMMTVLCAGSIGMVATPGGIGAYAFMLQKTMQLYGANSGIALAYGWVMWLMQVAVVLAGGLFSMIALPLKNRQRRAL